MLKTLLVLAALMAPAQSWAAYGTAYTPAQLGIDGVLLSGNPNFTLPAQSYTSLTLYINLTYVSATAVTLSCTAGNFANLQAPLAVATVASSGAITMADAGWSYPTGAQSRIFRIIAAPIADRTVTCKIGGTGATTDTVKVGAYGAM